MIEFIATVLLHSLWATALLALLFCFGMWVLADCSANVRYWFGCLILVSMLALPVATTLLLNESDNSLIAPGELARSHSSTPESTARITKSNAPFLNVVPIESNVLIDNGTWMRAAVEVWGCGVVLMLLRPMLGVSAIRRIKRSATGDLPVHVSRLVTQLCEQMQIHRVPAVLQSARINVPCVAGFLRPVVLLPVSLITGMPSDQLRALIAHELAHLRRLDHLVNWIQLGVETFAFYHPAMWWVSKSVRREREHCCDDTVICVCGDPASYAKALFTLELQRAEMAFALSASGGSVRRRIERFLHPPHRDRRSVPLVLGVIAITTFLLLPVFFERTANKSASSKSSRATASVSIIPSHRSIMTDNTSKPPLSNHPFWLAVLSNDVATARRLLESDPTLVSRDFRPEEKQDLHPQGFPLVQAARLGHLEMVKLFLEHGADVNAKTPHEEQREFATPLGYAVKRKDYEMANLLLDHGSSVAGYFWCTESTFDTVFAAAREDGASQEIVRRGLRQYLGEVDVPTVSDDAPDSVKLYDRFLTLGGQPSMESIVRSGYNDIVEELLVKVPEAPGTQYDYPRGTVFENLFHAATWYGYAEVVDLAMRCCPELVTIKEAARGVGSALVSHNRDGTVEDYYQLIDTQLSYLKDQGALETIIAEGKLQPHYILAKNYLRPTSYENESSPSSLESMIELSELLVRYGFDDFNYVEPKSGQTALARAEARTREGHPGMEAYAAYLIERGAESSLGGTPSS